VSPLDPDREQPSRLVELLDSSPRQPPAVASTAAALTAPAAAPAPRCAAAAAAPTTSNLDLSSRMTKLPRLPDPQSRSAWSSWRGRWTSPLAPPSRSPTRSAACWPRRPARSCSLWRPSQRWASQQPAPARGAAPIRAQGPPPPAAAPCCRPAARARASWDPALCSAARLLPAAPARAPGPSAGARGAPLLGYPGAPPSKPHRRRPPAAGGGRVPRARAADGGDPARAAV
jgi:hypothetical protein